MTDASKREFLKNSLSFAAASSAHRALAPVIALAGHPSQASTAAHIPSLHPVIRPHSNNMDYFVAVDSYRHSVESVLRYSQGATQDGAIIISDRHNINGMGSTSLMLVSRTLRLTEPNAYFHSSRFHRAAAGLSHKEASDLLLHLRQAHALYI